MDSGYSVMISMISAVVIPLTEMVEPAARFEPAGGLYGVKRM
jgi:hypothetical protein